jgi:hypothetical protein
LIYNSKDLNLDLVSSESESEQEEDDEESDLFIFFLEPLFDFINFLSAEFLSVDF